MHMADALLSPAVGTTMWAGTLGAVAYCSKKGSENIDEKMIPVMGVTGAFLFAAQMINFTIPGTGSSGHLGGGMLLAVLLGPHAAFLVMASVLTIQALFFADGGLFALGCNIWNLGVYPCFIAYPLIYGPLTRNDHGPRRITIASIVSVVVALQLGAFSVVLQTVLSGRSELPFDTFLLMMLPIHLAIGLVEGFVTAGVIGYVKSARPEILESVTESSSLSTGVSVKRIVIVFLGIALITGGVLSWFASSNPDGLEWSIEKVFGKPELPEREGGMASVLESVQEKTAILPEYDFRRPEGKPEGAEGERSGQTWPAVEPGRSASGIIGSFLVLAVVLCVGFVVKALRRKQEG
jgi:cobalt/nickel transport system permease protein